MQESTFQAGRLVEDYLIEKLLEEGAMAELFVAKDMTLKRRVVVKVLTHALYRKKEFKTRFLREARIQANLDNPHVVQIFRAFEHQKTLCLVMQHVKGTNLEAVIRKAKARRQNRGEKGALSLERSIHIFLQILEGIGFAHKYKIIHGDIKPSNILLDQQGRVRISDFGLSFAFHQGKKTRLPAGTPQYTSPEQRENREVDFRSDIYALGVTFFHMLTGEFPAGSSGRMRETGGGSADETRDRLRCMLDEAGVTPRVTRAILRALDEIPNDRPQSCLEFALAIKEHASEEIYSELLRLSLLTKPDMALAERAYLDKIAGIKGLHPEEADVIEISIRKELGLSPLDFEEEYRKAYKGLLLKEKGKKHIHRDELGRIYVTTQRISRERAEELALEAEKEAKAL